MAHITQDILTMVQGITIVDGDRVDDDTRWLLFLYATKVKRITYRELGISPAMGNMIKNRKRRVSDDLLDRLLDKLTLKDLIAIVTAYQDWAGAQGPEGARRLAWLGRRPDTAEVRGSNPRGPTTKRIIQGNAYNALGPRTNPHYIPTILLSRGAHT